MPNLPNKVAGLLITTNPNITWSSATVLVTWGDQASTTEYWVINHDWSGSSAHFAPMPGLADDLQRGLPTSVTVNGVWSDSTTPGVNFNETAFVPDSGVAIPALTSASRWALVFLLMLAAFGVLRARRYGAQTRARGNAQTPSRHVAGRGH
jgi:hypothetical protein